MKLFALAAAALLSIGSAAAQEVSISGSLDYTSKYTFRGFQLAEGAVQPGVEFSTGGFTAGVWHSAPTENDDFYLTETDVYAGYAWELSPTIGADVGVTYYAYDDDDANTTEIYGGLNFAGAVEPSVYLYYDLDLEAWTLEGAGGYSIPVAEKTSLDLGGSVGAITADDFDAQYLMASANLTYAVAETVSAYAGVNVGANSEDSFFEDADAAFEGDFESTGAWFGVGLSFSN